MRKAILTILAVVVFCAAAFFAFRSRIRRTAEEPSPEGILKPVERVEEEAQGEVPSAGPALPLDVQEAVVQLKDGDLRLSASEQLIEEWKRTGEGSLHSLIEGEVVPLLLDDYRASTDIREKEKIIDLLGRIDSERTVSFLSEIMKNGDRRYSRRALAALVRSSRQQAADAVAGFIGSSLSGSIGWEAAREAATHGGAALAPPLIDLSNEGEPRAKILAIHAMKGIYDRTQDEKLGAALSGEALSSLSEMAQTYLDLQIKRDAWDTLGYVDPGRAFKLYRQQEEMPYAVEERAVLSIGRNGDMEVSADAISLFDSAESDRKRISASRIVGLIVFRHPDGTADNFVKERALPFLREVAADGRRDQQLRKLAIAGLGESGDSECLPLLKKLGGEYPREAGRAIKKLRSRVGTRRTGE